MDTLKEADKYREMRIAKLLKRMPAVQRALMDKLSLEIEVADTDISTVSENKILVDGAKLMFNQFRALHGLASILELMVLTMNENAVEGTIDQMEELLKQLRNTYKKFLDLE